MRFYESRQRGLGSRLWNSIDEAISRIENDPTSYEFVESNIHRCPVKKFPYSVYYLVPSDDQVVVFAIAHHKRRFGYWKHRVQPKDKPVE